MPNTNPGAFAHLLKQGVAWLKLCEGRKKGDIQDDLAFALDRSSRYTIQHWAKGNIPAQSSDVAGLARSIVSRLKACEKREGVRSREEIRSWCVSFLESTAYPPQNLHLLLEELFPTPTFTTKLFGREAEITSLVELLLKPYEPWVVALVGLGGIGKTALAKAISYEVQHSGRFEGCIWWQVNRASGGFPAGNPLLLDDLYLEIADHLWPHKHESWSTRMRRKQAQHKLREARPYLIIIDDIETVNEIETLLPHIEQMIGKSKVLLTTRATVPVTTNFNIYTASLSELASQDAFDLLSNFAMQNNLSHLQQTAQSNLQQVYEIAGGNPLALRLVAGLSRSYSLSDIATNLLHGQGQGVYALYQRIYAKIWSMLSLDARTILNTMLLVAETGTDLDYLQALTQLTRVKLILALDELLASSLLEDIGTSLNNHRYILHRLTHRFIQSNISNLDLQKGIQAGLFCWQNKLPIQDFEAERANLRQLIQYGLSYSLTREKSVELLQSLFQNVEQHGLWSEWISIWEKAVEDYAPNLLYIQLGHLYRRNMQYKEAIETHQTAVQLAQKNGDELSLAQAYFGLTENHRLNGQLEKAQKLAESTIEVLSKQPNEPEWLAGILNSLGLIAHAQQNWIKAEENLIASADTWRKTDKFVELAKTLSNLGVVFFVQNKFEPAKQVYFEAISILSKRPQLLDTVRVYNNLAILYYRLGNLTEALNSLRQIEVDRLEQVGDIRLQAEYLHNLGNTLVGLRRFREAISYLSKSEGLWHDIDDKLFLANTLGTLGEALAGNRQVDEAISAFTKAQTLLETYPNHSWAIKLKKDFLQALQQLH